MPAATKYFEKADTTEAQELERKFTNEQRARSAKIKANWNYYMGEYPDMLRPDGTQIDDNLMVPLVRMLIDKRTSGMLGVDDKGDVQGIKYEAEGDNAAIQGFIDTVWEVNKKNLLHYNLFRLGSLAGHSFIKIMPDYYPDPDSSNKRLPRLIVLNPANCYVFWREDDMDEVLWYRIEYDTTRQDVVRKMTEDGKPTGAWEIIDFRRETKTSPQWKETNREMWNWEYPPIVDWQNQPNPMDYYGLDDLGNLVNLNIGYNFTLSNMQRIIKYKASPMTILTGATVEQVGELPSGANKMFTLPDGATAENLELSGDALNPSLQHAAALREAFFTGARELDPATTKEKLGQLTNFGLRVLNQDSLGARQTAWMCSSEGLKRLMKTVLVVSNQPVVNVQIIPPDPLPENPTESIAQDTAIFDRGAMSKATLQERNNLDPDTERERMLNESVDADIMTSGAPVGVSG